MNASPAARLYSIELLGLATQLADYPIDPALPFQGEARSRACGSSLRLSLGTDQQGRIAAVGLSVSACAVGQAAASIFAQNAGHKSAQDIQTALSDIEHWLTHDQAAIPDWPGFAALVPAREHTGRHGALVLPWKAAIAALSKADFTR